MEAKGHDRKCDRATSLRCGTAQEAADDHDDGHVVVGLKEPEAVLPT